MRLFSKAELQTLIEVAEGPCISIYMPAEKAGPETRQNSIRFKNSLDRAEEKLAGREEISSSQIDSWLAPAKTLLEDNDFWQHQNDGLAVFIAPKEFRYYRLPQKFEELVVASDRFHFKPLVPLIMNDGKFYLLALSQNQLRFFQGTPYGMEEIELPTEVPANMADALKYDDTVEDRGFHGGTSGASFHGQGVVTSEHKKNIERYIQKIDNGLHAFLHDRQAPLILAGVDFLLSTYRKANSYAHLIEQGIPGNPENASIEELHRQAWEIVRPYFDKDREAAENSYRELLGTGQASAMLEQVVPAAYNGQVDTLYVPAGIQCWGKFDPQSNAIEIHSQPEKNDIDLFDFAAVYTVLQSGKVYLVEPDRMPEKAKIAAIFRYPLFDGQFPDRASVIK